MHETLIQDKFLIDFITRSETGLQFREIKANTVSPDLIATPDLFEFLSNTELNKIGWKQLLRKYGGDEKKLLDEVVESLQAKIKDSTNMAVFLNSNKSFTFDGVKLHLFYPSDSEVVGDKLFDQNIYSVAQEYPYKFSYEGRQLFSFRPDLTFFVNGFYIGYSEFKSTYNNQNASKQGRGKVIADYLNAVQQYDKIAGSNDVSLSIRKSFLRIFEKAIFITATDISETYVIRGIEGLNAEIRGMIKEARYDFEEYKNKALAIFKSYPVSSKKLDRLQKFEEVLHALYSKKMLEKEILYYNFIETDLVTVDGKREFKNEKGKLISPRPKQKFGTDKIIAKIDEFLEHENDDDYFLNKLKDQLAGVGEDKRNELINKRQKYQNNKNVYSLLLQYAAGFGKSNIIGWSTLQLKDLKRDGKYVYDKVMIVVDRLQLRDQITAKMYNMNVNNKMFIEASNKKNFVEALSSDTRIVIVNLQKFGSIKEILDQEVVKKLSNLRIAFLIDEIHRSQSGDQHEDMVSLFDELQSSFDKVEEYKAVKKKKNLIVGFTATPSDHTLARFGEFNHITEGDKIWVPFDSYTMKEAIEDGYILNPLKGIVPVSAKMYFEKPEDVLEGFEGDNGYEEIENDVDTGIDVEGKKYAIRKKKIYSDPKRIEAISEWIVDRLVNVVYPQIRRRGKAMLAVSSKANAIKYKENIDRIYGEVIQLPKYKGFEKAPIYIVYSDDQENATSSNLNNGLTEKKVIEDFGLCNNGLMIVVDKLQTGFDEPKLHTLFLDKEIQGINAIQTISRVNRTCKYKNDCKIIDYSYKNVNVKNITKAFEHFSNVVVSDFDPLGDEKLLGEIYSELLKSNPYQKQFTCFKTNFKDKTKINDLIEVQTEIINFIKNYEKEAKNLKHKIGKYFQILNLIENVISVEVKYCDKIFLEFWSRFNIEYRNINKTGDIIDDVEIYFDNKIGFVDIQSPEETKQTKKKAKVLNNLSEGKKYRYDILNIIAKRNEEELELESKIMEFENKIDLLFDFVDNHTNGKKLQVKMKSNSSTISEDEICSDFEKIYNEFIRKNRNTIGEFFIKQSKELVNQLCSEYKEKLL
jgi:type I restriction enzyme, R subunit